MILSKIKNFFLKNKKEILFFSFLTIFIFTFFDNTFAEETTSEKGINSLITGINFFIGIFSSIIGLLSSLVGLILSPGWINGSIFGLDVYLKDIWILISNIVYFAFAFVLIAIAFVNIIGKGGGTWELKSALPKFVVGVIMVPFTWFFVQFILSISAFLTIAVLSLPYDVMEGRNEYNAIKNNPICVNYTFKLTTKSDTDTTKEREECLKGPQITKDNSEGTWVELGDLLSGKIPATGSASSFYSIINVYTYGIMKIDQKKEITKKELGAIKTMTDLGLKLIFDILFMIVFLIIIIALFMALFARGVWLWLYAMFSPVFGLLFFFGKSDGVGKEKFGPLEFIYLALVPVYVSAALAFGMIFMFVAAHGLSNPNPNGGTFLEDTTKDGVASSKLTLGVFTVNLVGIRGETANDAISSTGNGIGKLLMEIFGLTILWIAVMAALKSSQITEKAVAPIISFGESIGSLVAKAPQYAPIIPTPGGGMSMTGLNQVSNAAVTSAQQYGRKSGDDFMKRNGLFGQGGEIAKSVTDAANIMKTYGAKNEKTGRAIGKAIDSYERDVSKIIGNSSLMDTISKQAKDMGILKDKEIIDNQNKLAKVIGQIEYKYQTDSSYPGQMFEGKQELTSAGFTKDALKKSYNKDSKKESPTATGATTATAKTNTAINIKSINKNTNNDIIIPNGDKEIKIKKSDIGNELTATDFTKIKKQLEKEGIKDTTTQNKIFKKIEELYSGDDKYNNPDGVKNKL